MNSNNAPDGLVISVTVKIYNLNSSVFSKLSNLPIDMFEWLEQNCITDDLYNEPYVLLTINSFSDKKFRIEIWFLHDYHALQFKLKWDNQTLSY
jgi:hypothetical protein